MEYLLDSVLASTMISNSEYIVMLNQAEPDRAKLATLLNISTEQMGYITNADAGCGLVKYGSSLVPVSYTHLRAHETRHDLVCRLLLEKKKDKTAPRQRPGVIRTSKPPGQNLLALITCLHP